MFLFVFVSRLLGAEGLGEYQIIVTYPAIFEMIAALGLWPLLIRNVARRPEEAFRYLLHGSALSLSVGLLLVVPMGLSGVGYSPVVQHGILVLSFSLMPSALMIVSEAVLIARGRPQAIAMLLLAENVVLVGSSALVLFAGYGIVAIAVNMLTFRLLSSACAVAMAVRACPQRRWGLEWSFALALLREAPVFLASSFAWALYSRLDVLVLSRLTDIAEVGYYAAAQRLLLMCQEIPQSLLLVMFPILAAEYGRDPVAFQQIVGRTAKYLIIVALPIVLGAVVLGPDLMQLIYGYQFRVASPVLCGLMLSFLLFGLMKLLGSSLIATDHQRADLVINVIVLAVTFVLLVCLVPRWGSVGAAYAMLGSVVAAVGLRAAYFRRHIQPLRIERRVIGAIPATAVLWLLLVSARALPLPLLVAAGTVVYAVSLLVFGALTRPEIESVPGLGAMLNRRRFNTVVREEVGDVWHRR